METLAREDHQQRCRETAGGDAGTDNARGRALVVAGVGRAGQPEVGALAEPAAAAARRRGTEPRSTPGSYGCRAGE